MTKGQRIRQAAWRRARNRVLARAYTTSVPWVFTPHPRHQHSYTKSEIMLALATDVVFSGADVANEHKRKGKAARVRILNLRSKYLAPLRAKIRRELGNNLQRWPGNERMIWAGHRVLTCNIFVGDALYCAGTDLVIGWTGLYPGPVQIYNGGMRTKLAKIKSLSDIRPGDVFASRRHCGLVDGAGVHGGKFKCLDSYNPIRSKMISARPYRFFRVTG
jgi:hypothetical protein